MCIDLKDYTLTYYITILPNIVLYSALTKAHEYFNFENFEVPLKYKDYPIECIFCLYDKDGIYIDSAHTQASYATVKAVINTYPLKLLTDLVSLQK